MHQKMCEYFVTNDAAVEAAIVISGNGFALAWHTRKNNSVEEVLPVGTALLAAAGELRLFDTASHASMLFETAFGALHLSTIDADTLLVLCLTEGYSFLTINSLLAKFSRVGA